MFKLKKFTKEQIYGEILGRADYDTLLDFARHNNEMQIRLKGFRLTKKSCPKERLIKVIMELSATNAMVENYILKLWNNETVFERAKMEKINTKKDAEAFVNSERFEGDWFKAATILMAHDKKILNTLGEEYYSGYLNKKSQVNEKEEEKLDMKNNKARNINNNKVLEEEVAVTLEC